MSALRRLRRSIARTQGTACAVEDCKTLPSPGAYLCRRHQGRPERSTTARAIQARQSLRDGIALVERELI